jgi:hypothetical protein
MVSAKIQSLIISFLLFCIVLSLTFPKYLEILKHPSPSDVYGHFFNKIQHPFTPGTQVSTASHESKIAFRLTAPLIAKLIGVQPGASGRSVVWLYVLQSVLLIPFLYMLQNLLKRYTSLNNSLLFVVACCATYLAKSFFWDYDFWFDGFAFFFILASMYFRHIIPVVVFSQLACWTDERAVAAMAGVYLFHLLREVNFEAAVKLNKQLFINSFYKGPTSYIFLSCMLYVGLRLMLQQVFGLSTPRGEAAGVSLSLIPFQFQHRLVGIFLTFEGLWIIFTLTMLHIYKTGDRLWFYLIGLILLMQLLIAYSVFDITRSITYAFPLFIITFIIFSKIKSETSFSTIVISTLICIAIPTQFLIFFPRQIPWTILSMQELKPIIKTLL